MNQTSYQILVKVSDGYKFGGTNSTVKVQFVGADGSETKWKTLDRSFHDDFEPGAEDKYDFKLLDIGMPCIVNIKLKHGIIKDDLACDYIKVVYKNTEKVFPIYDMVKKEYSALGPDSELPQKVQNELVRIQREKNLDHVKSVMEWNKEKTAHDGLTNHIVAKSYRDLPGFLKRECKRDRDDDSVFLRSVLEMMFKRFQTMVFPIKCLEDYHLYHESLDDTNKDYHEHKNWKTDEVFGWQVLNGVYPLSFKIMKHIPEYFSITDDDIKHLLGEGKSLESEIEAEKLFLSDFHEMFTENSGMIKNPREDGKPCDVPHAICLYYVNEKDKFVPICIQLKPNDRDYLFTADEESLDWLLAKMWIRNCMVSIHEWSYHYLYTHGFPEPFMVAAFRCLSTSHPIYRLLRPHLRTINSINQKGREVLIKKDSVVNVLSFDSPSVMTTFYKKLTLDDMDIPKVLHKYGVAPNKIPEYHYAQDTMKVWEIIKNYITGIVNLFYKSDKDILEDSEIQAFAYESAHLGFAWQDNNIRGVPTDFKTREELINLLTVVVGTSSAQHAAVNFGQWDHYKFIPMNPPIMNMPPHKKGEGTMERIMKSLPRGNQVVIFLATMHALSRYFEDQDFLGENPETWFFEPKAKEIQKKVSS